jgi:hypothetical protein
MYKETAPNEVTAVRLQSCVLVYLQLATKTKNKKLRIKPMDCNKNVTFIYNLERWQSILT